MPDVKDLRDWVDIGFKIVLAVVGIVVGYYFSFEKQQNDDIQMIVGMATDKDNAKRAMSGPIVKAYFDQKRIPPDVYVAIYSYVNAGADSNGVGQQQQAAFNTLMAASAKADPALAQAVANASASLPVRVFLHIRQEADRAKARAIQDRLAAATLPNAQPIVVPGIELVLGDGTQTILKCFKKAECATLGPTLVEVLKSNGLAISLSDQSAAYENSPTVRPNLFEIWFAKNFSS